MRPMGASVRRGLVVVLMVAMFAACRLAGPAAPGGEVATPSAIPAATATAVRAPATATPSAAPTASATATPTAVPPASATAVRPSATAAVVDRTPTVLALPSSVPTLNAGFRMEAVPAPVLPANAEIVASPGGTCSAITFIDETHHTAFLVRREDGQYYRLSAKWLPEWRPISNMKWLSEEILSAEMWGNPYNGYHFTVNVVTKQIIGVEAYYW